MIIKADTPERQQVKTLNELDAGVYHANEGSYDGDECVLMIGNKAACILYAFSTSCTMVDDRSRDTDQYYNIVPKLIKLIELENA